jgi:hypothetical protein
VAGRHSDIGQNSVRAQAFDRLQQLLGIAHGRQHVDLARVLQQAPGALAHEVGVLGDDDVLASVSIWLAAMLILPLFVFAAGLVG